MKGRVRLRLDRPRSGFADAEQDRLARSRRAVAVLIMESGDGSVVLHRFPEKYGWWGQGSARVHVSALAEVDSTDASTVKSKGHEFQ